MRIVEVVKLVAATTVLLATNVAVSVGVVAVYAYFMNPGQAQQHYEDFAVHSSPYSSVIAGMPLMFWLCWWLSRRVWIQSPMRAVWVVWLTYVVLDLGISFASAPMTMRLAVFTAVSLTTKLAAGLLGARYAAASTVAP